MTDGGCSWGDRSLGYKGNFCFTLGKRGLLFRLDSVRAWCVWEEGLVIGAVTLVCLVVGITNFCLVGLSGRGTGQGRCQVDRGGL